MVEALNKLDPFPSSSSLLLYSSLFSLILFSQLISFFTQLLF